MQITLRKLYRQATYHHAERRSVKREIPPNETAVVHATASEPTPDAIVGVTEELEHWLTRLDERVRRVVELRLQGEGVEDIAQIIQRSTKTVRRYLDVAKRVLLASNSAADLASLLRSDPHRSRGLKNTARQLQQREACEGTIRDGTFLSIDDYVLQKQIGLGATGKVYRAEQKSDQQLVAIKFLKKSFLHDQRVVSRFLAEANTIMRLTHPGIARVYGLGRTSQGGYFIVMEHAAGGDLSKQMPDDAGHLGQAITWLIQAADALAFAHREGVIHCDLKPANLLLNNGNQILATDFGFARYWQASTQAPHVIAGTPAFMAPEQVDPVWGEIGPATDIYGLGAVLFWLLFRAPPFIGHRIPDVLAQVISAQRVVFPEKSALDVTPELLALCQRCLEKNPRQRWASMVDLQSALRNLQK